MNIKILNEELHYNINIWKGYTKDELKTKFNDMYIVISIEEI